MSKISIPENYTGKQLFDFLVKNETQLRAQKKALPKFTDPIVAAPEYFNVKEKTAIKTIIGDIAEDAVSLRAKFVGNAANWFDSQEDVLLPDCWKKTISEGAGRLHLKDHTYKLEAEVGDVVNIYSQIISLTELGLVTPGTTQCLIYESDVKKEYDAKVFDKYKRGRINQHSIGLNYVKLFLAINDDDYKEEFATWNKYITQIINREDAEARGFFWAVTEIKLIECSAVLLGANKLTPTLEVSKMHTSIQPDEDSTDTKPLEKFDLSAAIQNTKFSKFF